jgi:hypothetical protein
VRSGRIEPAIGDGFVYGLRYQDKTFDLKSVTGTLALDNKVRILLMV